VANRRSRNPGPNPAARIPNDPRPQIDPRFADQLLRYLAISIDSCARHRPADRASFDRAEFANAVPPHPDDDSDAHWQMFDHTMDFLGATGLVYEAPGGTLHITPEGHRQLVVIETTDRLQDHSLDQQIVDRVANATQGTLGKRLRLPPRAASMIGDVTGAALKLSATRGRGWVLDTVKEQEAEAAVDALRASDFAAKDLQAALVQERQHEQLAATISPVAMVTLVTLQEQGQRGTRVDFDTTAQRVRDMWINWKPAVRPRHGPAGHRSFTSPRTLPDIRWAGGFRIERTAPLEPPHLRPESDVQNYPQFDPLAPEFADEFPKVVSDAMRELDALGLVEHAGRGYKVTPAGEQFADFALAELKSVGLTLDPPRDFGPNF
jgi:hypothetical protein